MSNIAHFRIHRFQNHVHGTVRLKRVRKATNSAFKRDHCKNQKGPIAYEEDGKGPVPRLVKEHIANLEQIGYNVSIGS